MLEVGERLVPEPVELRPQLPQPVRVGLVDPFGPLGAVADQGDGTYVATLTAPSAEGTATVTGRVNGANIADNAIVTFTLVAPNTLRLAFVQSPTNTQAGSPIGPAVSVRVIDLAGATVTSTGSADSSIAAWPPSSTSCPR